MISEIKQMENRARFEFVSDFVLNETLQSDPVHGEFLKQTLQTNLQRISDQEYASAVRDLRNSVRETQSPAAYILLAEAYAQAGQTEMALATLDVLRCVELDRLEAEFMKKLVLQKRCTDEVARYSPCFDSAGK